MKKIEAQQIETRVGTGYPAPYDAPCLMRERKGISDVAGLTQFGVNLLRLPPGAWSSQRHWHTLEDEFVFVVEGEVVLVTDAGEEVLRAGDSAGFKANDRNGHHVQNRSQEAAVLLEIGSRREGDAATYPDIDLLSTEEGVYTHRDGTKYR
jgi:uncharacterized cupin superfamily protein